MIYTDKFSIRYTVRQISSVWRICYFDHVLWRPMPMLPASDTPEEAYRLLVGLAHEYGLEAIK